MTKCNMCGGTTVYISSGIVKCEYCGRLYSTLNGELAAADPERLYSSAVSMSKSSNENTLKSAIETFEALGSYKDSSMLANSCRGMIAQSRVEAEERRLAAERQEEIERIEREKRAFEEKQKAKVKRIVISAVSAVAVLTIAIGVISNSQKRSSYNKAMELYNMGQYEEARETFSDLGEYSDATTYVSAIDNFLTERESKYEKGVNYYEKGAYSECIVSLADISDYLDSADYIEKSVEAIYLQATEYYDAGEYENAKELLEKIPDSSSKNMDAELLLADIEEIIIEQTNAANYEQAKNSYDSGDYEAAQKLFMGLGNYEDSATYLSAIGTSYYKQAMDLFNQKQYVQCGDVLQHIDTTEEWTEYIMAIELKQNASNAYVDTIRVEAENICRSEGYTAMASYVDGLICNILDAEGANSLKEECTIEVSWLHEMSALVGDNDEFWDTCSTTDNMGNSYKYEVHCGAESYSDEITYALDEKYTILSGTLGLRNADNDKKNGMWIEFYGDGKLIGESVHFVSGTRPYTFEIDVTGVTDLMVKTNSTSIYNSGFLLTDGFKVSE